MIVTTLSKLISDYEKQKLNSKSMESSQPKLCTIQKDQEKKYEVSSLMDIDYHQQIVCEKDQISNKFIDPWSGAPYKPKCELIPPRNAVPIKREDTKQLNTSISQMSKKINQFKQRDNLQKEEQKEKQKLYQQIKQNSTKNQYKKFRREQERQEQRLKEAELKATVQPIQYDKHHIDIMNTNYLDIMIAKLYFKHTIHFETMNKFLDIVEGCPIVTNQLGDNLYSFDYQTYLEVHHNIRPTYKMLRYEFQK
ncbi:UNKNOWN [Stylonychia lemnae]|uniref:Uncharacterized protein n=1 Tax=Stylonychia lemnae TaxID=5949 RepID=A0A078A3N5_STYLE|nr:UNKNOWN [Stylonychia lemnae]|eukprot:CDW76432.1 UNKNOWN [Stylonychia lemnae]